MGEACRQLGDAGAGRELGRTPAELDVDAPRRLPAYLDRGQRETLVADRQNLERRLLCRKARGEPFWIDAGAGPAVLDLALGVDALEIALPMRRPQALLHRVHRHEVDAHADRHAGQPRPTAGACQAIWDR